MQHLKKILLATMILGAVSLSGCKNVDIWEKPISTEAEYIDLDKLALNTYYVKNGTKFSKVYMPSSSFSGIARYVDQSRVIWMFDNQPFIPEHYKGEIIAYSSKSVDDLDGITLERFKDMGYSLGIYGGKVESDGYYHMDSKYNTCLNSNAAEMFSKVKSNEIRIVSLGGISIDKLIDQGSGIIKNLKEGQEYTMEFYAGTFFYRVNFIADTQFLKSMELYTYGADKIYDTLNGYMAFDTPTSLKSGYYLVNNDGLFLYHDHTKEEYVENEDLNVSGFESEAEALASYSQEFKISIPYNTKDVIISADISNLDNNATARIVSPDGTVYAMNADVPSKTMTLELSIAKAGDWMCYIPKYLNVTKVDVKGSEVAEETVCDTITYTYDTPLNFQRFSFDVFGTGRVYAYMERKGDLRTFDFQQKERKTASGKQKYFQLDLPYVEAGEYTVYIYYYQSTTEIGTMQITDYADSDADIVIIDSHE